MKGKQFSGINSVRNCIRNFSSLCRRGRGIKDKLKHFFLPLTGTPAGARRREPVTVLSFLLLCAGLCVCLSGCDIPEEVLDALKGGEPVKIVLTTGFDEDEVFRLEDASCVRGEILVYLAAEQAQYETIYGAELWEGTGIAGELEERLKEKALAELSQVKAMTLLAKRREIGLTAQEEELVQTAADRYCESMKEEERKELGVSRALVEGMYRDYALADKVYREIIRDINPEISDDEARTITVQHILIRTTRENEDGSTVPCSESEREQKYGRAREALQAVRDGETFESLIEKYSEDAQGTLSFGKGEKEAAFEEAAFNLGTGEVSGIVETDEGYEIIKCISTFNREETDRNKLKIAEKRRDEVFEQEYEVFVDSLARNFNEELWTTIEMPESAGTEYAGFFEIYREYFGTGKTSQTGNMGG